MKYIITRIALFVTFSLTAYCSDLSWDNLTNAYIGFTEDFDSPAKADCYMAFFRPEIWTSVRNDEFELNNERAKTIQLMKEKSELAKKKNHFVIDIDYQFGQYDFENGVFKVQLSDHSAKHWLTENRKISIPNEYGLRLNGIKRFCLPFTYTVEIVDPYVPLNYGFLRMDNESAKNFLQTRKDKIGRVDRAIYATIKTSIKIEENHDNTARIMLSPHLESVKFFSDNDRTTSFQHEIETFSRENTDLSSKALQEVEGILDIKKELESAGNLGKNCVLIFVHADGVPTSMLALDWIRTPLNLQFIENETISFLLNYDTNESEKPILIDQHGRRMTLQEFLKMNEIHHYFPSVILLKVDGSIKKFHGLPVSDSKSLYELLRDNI